MAEQKMTKTSEMVIIKPGKTSVIQLIIYSQMLVTGVSLSNHHAITSNFYVPSFLKQRRLKRRPPLPLPPWMAATTAAMTRQLVHS